MSDEVNSSSSSGEEQLSPNRIALNAINAYLAGHATSQQKEVTLGDKRLVYNSLSEILKWKRYFEAEVRKEEGKPIGLRFEKIYWGGI